MQTMKMAQALMSRAEISMFAAQGDRDTDLCALYGVRQVPDIRHLPNSGRLAAHLFGLRAALAARRGGARAVLTRSVIAAAWSSVFGLKTVYECHAPPQRSELFYWRILMRSRNLHRVAVISDALRVIMLERHPELADKEIVVAHDGVDLEQFAELPDAATAKSAVGLDPDCLIAGYAGHLYEGRGIEIIMACARALPHWHFRLVGGTPSDVERWRQSADGCDNLTFVGFVENSRLPEVLSVADVLLMPYQRSVLVSGGKLNTVRWMSPLKMFEYMAMNRAIVSSDLPVLREVLDQTNARLVEPDDATGWVEALRSLESEEARNRLAASASQTVGAFDWNARVDRLIGGLI